MTHPANRIILAFISAGLCLLILEFCIIRPWGFGTAAFSWQRMNSLKSLGHTDFIRRSDIPGLLYELKPDLNTWYQMVPFSTNSRGMADDEYSVSKPPGTYRVAVLGDSVSMAYGVPHKDNYHSLLEQRLNSPDSALVFEFLNFAVGGYGLPQYVAMLEHKALPFDPDMIMVGVYLNDFLALALQTEGKENSKSFLRIPPMLQCYLWKFLASRTFSRDRLGGSGRLSGDPEQQIHSIMIMAERYFHRISETGIRRRIPVAVLLLSHMATEETLNYFKAAGRIHLPGVNIIPAWKPFIGHSAQEFRIHPFDSHPNAEAHRMFASAVYEGMEKAGLWPREAYVQEREPPDQLLKAAPTFPPLKSLVDQAVKGDGRTTR
ncbi:SGNH/GDSL hydrolase family protein [bacterium]|nr:SGNH/GDSL hydrolase family protein [candidate division CSSED10-310 bacterium]